MVISYTCRIYYSYTSVKKLVLSLIGKREEKKKKESKKKKKKRNLSNWNNSGFHIDSSQSIRDSLLALVPYKISKLVSLINFRLRSSLLFAEDHTIN